MNYEVSSDDPQNYTSYTRESNFQSSGIMGMEQQFQVMDLILMMK